MMFPSFSSSALPFLLLQSRAAHKSFGISSAPPEGRQHFAKIHPVFPSSVRLSVPETATASISFSKYTYARTHAPAIFIITRFIFPSRDDVPFSRDTVRFESGPRGRRLARIKRQIRGRKGKWRKKRRAIQKHTRVCNAATRRCALKRIPHVAINGGGQGGGTREPIFTIITSGINILIWMIFEKNYCFIYLKSITVNNNNFNSIGFNILEFYHLMTHIVFKSLLLSCVLSLLSLSIYWKIIKIFDVIAG